MTRFQIIFGFLNLPLWITAQNIQFLEPHVDYWKLSQSQNKIIFMDFQAAWCKPCKLMEQNVFKKDEIARFYNENFINCSFNADSSDGRAVCKKYGVQMLPTFLFLDANGNILHRAFGYKDVDAFLTLGKTALDSTKRFEGIKKRFLAGYRDTDFLKTVAEQAFEVSDTSLMKQSATAYLLAQKDVLTPNNMNFIRKFTQSADFEGFKYILAHQDSFQQKFGQMYFWRLTETFIPNDLSRRFPNLYEKEQSKVDLRARLKPFVGEDMSETLISMATIFQLDAAKQNETLITAIVEHVQKFKTKNPNTLINLGWMIYEKSEQPDILRQATDWALQAIQIREDGTAHEIAAHLFFKNGDKINAKFHAEQAIELAKTTGENVSDAQILLNDINK
jgi:thioredoxin-related protein